MLTADKQRVVSIAAVVLAGVIMWPFVVSFSPQIYFDIDPTGSIEQPITTLGPAGGAWMSVIGVAVAAGIMGLCVWLGQAVAWWAVGLVAMGVIAQLLHFNHGHPDNFWFGGAWISAACLGLAAYHLGQFYEARRWLIAAWAAMLVPVAIDSVWFVLIEHPYTIASYLSENAKQLSARGFEPGSSAYQLYTRRLESSGVLGAFSLANVLGSLIAAMSILAAAVAMSMKHRGARVAAIGCAVAGVATVVMTHSKGAAGALIVGAIVLVLVRVYRQRSRVLTVVVMGAVFVVVAGVGVRGMMGPPPSDVGIEGERSLLFRYQYWQGAKQLVVENPLFGTGQEGFREGYLRTKNSLSPEDVSSAHNVFLDWITTLGLGGWAWSVVLLGWLIIAARGGKEPPLPQASSLKPQVLLPCAVIGAVVFGLQYALESPQYWLGSVLLWLVSLLGFVGLMGLFVRSARPSPWIGAGLLAAATALVAHNQLSMVFHHASSVAPGWVMVALAGAYGAKSGKAKRWDGVVVLLMVVLMVILMVRVAGPVTQQQAKLAQATQMLRTGHADQAMRLLDESAEFVPADSTTLKWRIVLRLQLASWLESKDRPVYANKLRSEALALCQPQAFGGLDSYRLDRWQAVIYEQSRNLDQAIAARQRVIERLPYSLPDRLALADRLREAHRDSEAAQAYRTAMQISNQYYLDPARQLNEQRQQQIADYLAEVAR